MSLFKTRDWWSTTCGNGDEEFDQGCICVANIDNASDNLDKIIVGSYSGVLRVFLPSKTESEDDKDDDKPSTSMANSLLLEAQLSAPALQVTAGRFVSTSRKLYLTILHSRKLSVYGITAVEGSEVVVDVGAHYQLGLMYEHVLQRSAARMVAGPFGGVEGRDFTCVLSLDGTLSFFEQESFAFACFLPGAILPGPLAYVPHPTDAFVTASSAYLLEVYRYQSLAVASDGDKRADGQNVKTGKKLAMDWFYNIGECAMDISVVTLGHGGGSSSLIYVLGEHHLFCLKDTGALKFMKKMEFSPSCFHIYVHGSESAAVFVLVASHSTRTLMIYRDFTLKWASQLEAIPVAIRRTDLQGLRSAIVSLSEEGKLACSYLGTNPSIFTPPALESRDIDYKETDIELAEMHRIINASQKSGTLVTRRTEALLQIKLLIVPKEEDMTMNFSNSESGEQMDAATSIYLIKVQLSATLPLEGVQVTCHFENSLTLSPPHLHFGTLSDNTVASFAVQLSKGFVPSTLTGTVAAIYTGVLGGSPSIVRASIKLPLKLVLRACPPQKDADFKITIGVRTAIVKLNDLFPEFVDENSSAASQAMGFQYHHEGPIVTILVAKTSQRYRFQSDSFGAMSLLVEELQSRLEKIFLATNSKSGDDQHQQPTCVYSSPLPLSEFFFVVNSHLQLRLNLRRFEKRLSQLAAQFRAIQKRLLSKFKDKTTTPVANLDTLLEATHKQIMATALSADECKQNLQKSLCLLNGAARFLCLLLKLFANLKDSDYDLVTRALCPQLEVETEQGWEEMVTNNVAYLLETKYKSGGSSQKHSLTNMPNDIGPVKSTITRLTELFSRGVSIEEPADEEADKDLEQVVHGLPVGSVFGHKVKAVRFRPSSLPSNNNNSKNNVDLDGSALVSASVENMEEKERGKEVEGVGDTLSDIHTVSFDAHGDFY